MTPLTVDQAVVISGYTGFLCCNFSELHADVEKRLGYPVWTHQFSGNEMRERLKEIYRDDFIAMCAPGTPKG